MGSSAASQSSDDIEQRKDNENGIDVSYEDRWGATFFEQCHILFSRAMKTRRLDSLAIQTYITMLALALILGRGIGKSAYLCEFLIDAYCIRLS